MTSDEVLPSESDPERDSIAAQLADFLDRNPEASLVREDHRFAIKEPWGDETIDLMVKADDVELITALNRVRLPPEFIAVNHIDSGDLEFIWTALPIQDEAVVDREFVFAFDGTEYNCRFGASSDELLAIARYAKPVAPPTESAHRNLQSYALFFHYQEEHPEEDEAKGTPMSLWIQDVDLSLDDTIELCRHLNFYSSYYDRRAPYINILDVGSSDPLRLTRLRFPFGPFPKRINGRSLDPYLIGIWESANHSVDPFRLYLYYFQIVEYVAFYHVRDQVYSKIRRLLSAPDVTERPDAIIRNIADHLAEDRRHDTQKFQDTIEDLVDPEVVWRALQPNLAYFTEEVVFEGGMVIEPLVKDGWGLDDFRAAWMPKFPNTIREIRNGLVHAREARQSAVIAPDERNYRRLRPWLDPLMMTAAQVMLFWDR